MDTCTRATIRDLVTVQENIAGVRRNETDNHIKRRGLSCTVWSEKPADLSLPELEIDLSDDLSASV